MKTKTLEFMWKPDCPSTHRFDLTAVDGSTDGGAGLCDHILSVRKSHHLDLRRLQERKEENTSLPLCFLNQYRLI